MDFTIKAYKSLLQAIKRSGIPVLPFDEFIATVPDKAIVLRHDVDLLPGKSRCFAMIQHEFGIRGTYYFRAVKESWDESIIKEISALGNEIGYHYETMDTVRGNVDMAWDQFRNNLDKLRKLADVNTICMHGSPKSKFDNKDVWKKYNYKSLGITAEPYLDVNFNNVFYLTDTGRRWDGYKVSVRDKLPQQEEWNRKGLSFHSTKQIVKAFDNNWLPDRIMFTFHPQRWHSQEIPWLKELIFQNTKNIIKYFVIKSQKSN